MAVAKKKIRVNPGEKSPAARKAARPAVRKKPGGKGTAGPAAKVVLRTARPKPAQKKIAAKKTVEPRKAMAAAKDRKPGAQKKTAGKKPLTPKTAAGKTARVLPPAGGEKPVAPKKTPAKKPEKKVAAVKRPARAKEDAASLSSTVNFRFRDLKGMLIAKRNSILKEAKEEIAKYMSGDNRQLVDTAIDEGDWAVVDISEDLSLRRLDSHRQLLLDIDECLRKIQEGTYGICEECGEEISQKRLNVLPTATLCIDCKENKEKMEALEHVTEI